MADQAANMIKAFEKEKENKEKNFEQVVLVRMLNDILLLAC